ncbi:glycoside hydrolase family 88 protein [Lapidilactobacillus mulanensis]|uniref:Glycoside hydrolase family 88 protein n=1 Tax=Lapidilactobacillus mulanensis TaxID=2485999 RepID=A0ABW4DMF4_9LACO|nr:glycoside hydrolase family 88 protein [Lapidilactobacillus mulanensis]
MASIDDNWIREMTIKINKKMRQVVERNQHIIPYTTDSTGHYIDVCKDNPYWWTNGFWGGILWQLYHLTGDEIYQRSAIETEKKLDLNLGSAKHLDHDNGFKWSLTSVAHYRITQDSDAKNRALLAAENLAGRFNLSGQYIRAWNDNGDENRSGTAIIDCMMNLPLLYWASEEEQDPRFYQIALAHAKTAQKYIVRPDGSVKHIINFDPNTGEYLNSVGGQGYAHGSSWTRGQAWGIYGFTLSYQYTNDVSFLDTAKQIAQYFIADIPDDSLIPVDFRMPKSPWFEDSSASAIAASGLIELSKYVDKTDANVYLKVAMRLLRTLDQKSSNWDNETDNILTKCSAQYFEDTHEYPIIYGDYFFIEAILKLSNQAMNIW